MFKVEKFHLVALVVIVLIIGAVLIVNRPVPTQEPLKIGVIVYPGFAPFFVAKEKGFFEQEGVNADVIIVNDVTQIGSLMASNNVQIMLSSVDLTPIIASQADVKEIFIADVGYGSDGLLVKNDVTSIQDLKGKNVYLQLGTPSHFLFRVMAKDAGLEKNDVTLVDMPPDQVGAAFVAGQIDYGMSWEPWLSNASERQDGKVLVSSRDNPGIITDTFMVRSDVLQSRREDVKKVVRAWFTAIDFWKSNPTEANAIMAKNLGLPIEDFEAQIQTVKFLNYNENLVKFERTTPLNVHVLTKKAVEIWLEDGIIQSEVKSDNIVDSTVIQELYR